MKNLSLSMGIMCALLCVWACAPGEISIYDAPFASYPSPNDILDPPALPEPPDPPAAIEALLAFSGADFESGTVGATVPSVTATSNTTRVYDGSVFKNGGKSMKIDGGQTSGNLPLYFSPPLVARGDRDLLTFWAKGKVIGTLRLFLTTSGTVSATNRVYDFAEATPGTKLVEGDIDSTSSGYSAETLNQDSWWVKYSLRLSSSTTAYSAATASIQLRVGSPATSPQRLCQMNFDDFQWEYSVAP